MTSGRIAAWLRRAALCVLAAALAACVPIEPPRLGAGPPVITPKQAGTLGPAPVTGANVTFALEPLTNAPAAMLFSFEDQLKALAPTRQLRIVPAEDTGADYRLKGYLSAVGDSSSTLMVYVWDVYSPEGTRIHRISGQVRAGGSLSDPWENMSDSVVQTAASETVDALGNWVHSN